jgi:DNA-binding MarR family transcriptional regulator
MNGVMNPDKNPENEPLFLLYDVGRLMRTRADQAARSMGMTRAQWVILLWVEMRPGLSQNELASLVEVEPITVGRLVDRLEARGMIERRNDPKDRRIHRLHLADEAKPTLDKIQAYRTNLNAQFAQILGPEAWAQLRQSLAKIKAQIVDDSALFHKFG